MFKRQQNDAGFTLVEIIIAISILVVAFSAIYSMVSQQAKQTVRLTDQTECQNFAQSMMDKIASMGVRDNVFPAFAGSVAEENSFYQGEQLNHFFSKMPAAAKNNFWGELDNPVWGRVIDNNGNVSNSHLILSATTYLESLYNSNPTNYCAGTVLPNELTQGLSLNNVTATITITPKTIDGSALAGACTQPFRSAPKGTNDPNLRYNRFIGNTNVRYNALIEVNFQTPQNETLKCKVESSFGHQHDPENTGSVSAITPSAIAGTWNTTSNPPTLCDGQSIEFLVDVASFENGSVPLCRADLLGPGPQTLGNWAPCNTVVFPGQTGATTVTAQGLTAFRVRFEGLPSEKWYAFNAGSVDTAGNLSLNATATEFLVDMVRPNMGAITPVSNVSLGASPFQSLYYQCNIGQSVFSAGYQDDPLNMNWTDCTVSSNPVLTLSALFDGSTCQITAGPGFLASNTNYTLTATAADVCDSGGTETFQWWALPQPIPVTITSTNNVGTNYRVTLSAGAPSGLVRAQCDGNWVGGAVPGTWYCDLGQEHGTCINGPINSYKVVDICSNPNPSAVSPLLSPPAWSASNACYPLRAQACETRFDTGKPPPTIENIKCPAGVLFPASWGYYSMDATCGGGGNCDSTATTPPTRCEAFGGAGCNRCYYCKDICGGGVGIPFYYNPADTVRCNGNCLENQRCLAGGLEAGCYSCQNICPIGQFVKPYVVGNPDCSGEDCCNDTCAAQDKYCISTGGDCHRCRSICDDVYPDGSYQVEDCATCPDDMKAACSNPPVNECYTCQCPSGQDAKPCGGGTAGKCEQVSANCYRHCEPDSYLLEADLPACGAGSSPEQLANGCWKCSDVSCAPTFENNPCPAGCGGGNCIDQLENPPGTFNCHSCEEPEPEPDPSPGSCPQVIYADQVSECTFSETPPSGVCDDETGPCTHNGCTGTKRCTLLKYYDCDRNTDGNMPWKWHVRVSCRP